MPVILTQPIKALSEQEFYDVDYHVMRLAFETHNDLGRFCHEEIYQNELLSRCKKDRLKFETEVKIELTHEHFHKNLFIDALIESGAIYEFKTARAIDASHRVQTLDYMLLSNIKHGKIINFRPASVEHEFVSSALTQDKRRNLSITDKYWSSNAPVAEKLMATMINLLMDWGAFLNTDLYKEALCYLLGDGENIIQPIEIRSRNTVLGKQKIPLLSSNESFCISSIRNGTKAYRTHMERFLQHTSLNYLHWINIDNQTIQFETLHS